MLKLWTIYVPRLDEDWLASLSRHASGYLLPHQADIPMRGCWKGQDELTYAVQIAAGESAMHHIANQAKEFFGQEQILYVQSAPQARFV